MSATLAAPAPLASTMNPRTRLLLHGKVAPTLLRLAWPNTLVMLAQASVGLIETWWVSRLGTDALAGMALVFPGFMMMQMLSAGAIGGGIASAIARALGGGRREDADALVLHALLINGALGLGFTALVLRFGPALYGALGGGLPVRARAAGRRGGERGRAPSRRGLEARRAPVPWLAALPAGA